MKRAAIYARFSSDRQNEQSCQDQIDLCSAWADMQGFTVVETFQDQAVSGASTVNRFGLACLMQAAQTQQFDIVICEALDRLSRDQADLGQIRKELTFHDISIHTVQDGEVGTLHVGIKGLMGELYLADLAQKTKRGLRAVVKEGRQAGGRSYGYDLIPGKTGEFSINQQQAAIIKRIFTEYTAGNTPRQIATGLNQDTIPSPRGGKWNASTINGSRSRQNGILQNRLYIGQIIWNRQRFVKNPATGKRVSRANPENEWLIVDAPELRIIDDNLFEQANALKAKKGAKQAVKSRKPRYILSGLTKCGCCGASYTIISNNRMGCAGYRERGDCDNNRTITRKHIEQRVLSALQTQLANPEMVAEYISTYHEERTRLLKEARRDIADREKHLTTLTADIERIVDLMIKGTAPKAMEARIHAMEAEQRALASELAALKQEDSSIALHPGAAEKYKRIVADLHCHLDNLDTLDAKDAIFSQIRALIEKVIITPTGERKPVDIQVEGKLATLLSVSSLKEAEGFRVKLVAGAGFEPTTFGL